ncbi:hypothetical protein BU24DRAFT_408794 [Aaosphaeria arxii CBS 175.79]|uniref:Uncharacterized protein n=1 Tax=Aaosphaeria arxii CBS 175.79 TaxID=1450172 RepID=A0A6A5XRQ9_9PLEO|nr:uncharacterized protein BU24DRAFT_408794 [Aaosphaeria arxii CBS 175.79]KAF2015589.1 hypothetical protein BU24DRAFT_408794 [Aaosphaeria arxii CBS 175.79]
MSDVPKIGSAPKTSLKKPSSRVGKSREAHKVSNKKIQLTKGDPQKTRSFVKLDCSEGELTAYLGYTDVAQLRNFALSPYVLKFYNHLLEDDDPLRKYQVLELLRDRPGLFTTDDKPSRVFPFQEDKKHIAHRQALSTAQMVRAIRKGDFSQAIVQTTHSRFEELTKRRPPPINMADLRLPTLGPLKKLGEDDLEAYNRAINLLRYIRYSTNNSVWPKRFGSQNWDNAITVKPSHIPVWMRPEKMVSSESAFLNDVGEPTAEDDQAGLGKSRLVVKMIWRLEAMDAESQAFREHIKEMDPEVSLPGTMQLIHMEPSTTEAQFRDFIRQQYSMQEIKAEIDHVCLRVDPGEKSDQFYSLSSSNWADLKEILWNAASANAEIPYDTALPNAIFYLFVRKSDIGVPIEEEMEESHRRELQSTETIAKGGRTEWQARRTRVSDTGLFTRLAKRSISNSPRKERTQHWYDIQAQIVPAALL